MGHHLILSDEFLAKIAMRHPSTIGFLPNLARERVRMCKVVEQINRAWDSLPADMKNDVDLRARMLNVNDSSFRGALSEVFTSFVLGKLDLSIISKPQLGSQTPDFYVRNKSAAFIVESACIGRVEHDREVDRIMELFRAEINGVKANFWIHLVCPPIPNSSSNLHGLGRAIERYLKTDPLPQPKDDSDGYGNPSHWVEHNGAKAGFSVTPRTSEGGVFAGAQLGIRHGDSGAEALKRVIQKKIEKYRFPFVLAAVVDSDADLDSLLKAMIGTPAFSFPVHPEKGALMDETMQTHSNDGFWGTKNPQIHKHLHLQAVLFIKQHYTHDHGIRLYVHLLENVHLHTGLGAAIGSVPELMNPSYEGKRSEMPGLLLEL